MDESLNLFPASILKAGREKVGGFTLVEMMVATAILLVILGILLGITQETSRVWKNANGKIEVFQNSRAAFDAMTRTLSQATLNTYYDYFDANGVSASEANSSGSAFTPATYGRQSDLQFISGQGSTLLTGLTKFSAVTHAVFFQAPLGISSNSLNAGLGSLLNACGFYVCYGPDSVRPNFLPTVSRYRYRLMEFAQASDALGIYVPGNKGTSTWFLKPLQTDLEAAWPESPTSDFVLGENVIALVILPKLAAQDEILAGSGSTLGTALAPSYTYDSTTVGQGGSVNSTTGVSQNPALNSLNQLPPVVQVTMVAIDEASAIKLGNTTTPPNDKLGLTAALFTQASNYQADLHSLTTVLSTAHLNYRVFQTDVALRGAKWTTGN